MQYRRQEQEAEGRRENSPFLNWHFSFEHVAMFSCPLVLFRGSFLLFLGKKAIHEITRITTE